MESQVEFHIPACLDPFFGELLKALSQLRIADETHQVFGVRN